MSKDDLDDPVNYGSIVKNNLMKRPGYVPYCGNDKPCFLNWPRATFDGEQFKCRCGWRSQHDEEFIKMYKERWSIKYGKA